MAEWLRVASEGEIPPSGVRRVNVRGVPIAVFHVEGRYYATSDTCTHAEASLAEGKVEGHTVVCPRHGARFDVRTGAALSMPASVPLDTYPVEVRDGGVFIDVEGL
ncbi:MAG: non-heme iron oxygenase ferredoxin subunit [Clostridia bacterium]|nr:non-heme iron oxygenase ferredoxin subunit [Clostridia bacterium]